MNIIVILFVIGILISLGTAFAAMLKGGKQNSEKMFKSLVVRVGLSLVLFALLLIGKLLSIF